MGCQFNLNYLRLIGLLKFHFFLLSSSSLLLVLISWQIPKYVVTFYTTCKCICTIQHVSIFLLEWYNPEFISSASRKKGLILGRLRPFQFPQKGHLTWNDNNSKIMAYFWQFSFCIHKNIPVFIWKRSQSQFSLITAQGEIKKKPLTLIISKLRLARRSALSTFLREADDMFQKNTELQSWHTKLTTTHCKMFISKTEFA